MRHYFCFRVKNSQLTSYTIGNHAPTLFYRKVYAESFGSKTKNKEINVTINNKFIENNNNEVNIKANKPVYWLMTKKINLIKSLNNWVGLLLETRDVDGVFRHHLSE